MDDWDDDDAEQWDRDAYARSFADQALASLVEHVSLEAWKRLRVLDFGCGTGLLTERLAPLVREVVAVDISPSMLEVLRSKQIGNVSVHCVDIADPAVRAQPWFGDFDLIVAAAACADLPDYPATVAQLAQALKPAGRFIQWDWLASDEDEDDDGLTSAGVADAFERAGLTIVRVDRAFSVSFEDDEVPVLIGVARRAD